jgi:ZIP family zinc transporter
MLSAATLGLLGHALEAPLTGGRVAQVAIGLVAGGILILVADRLIPHVQRGLLLTGAMALHRVPEGFAVGAAYAASDPTTRGLGILLALAVGFQNACEGLVMSAPFSRGGAPRGPAIGLMFLTVLPLPLFATAGYFLSAQLGAAMPLVLALAAGTLITLTSNEIIPETHSHGNEVVASLGIVGGFLITILLRAVLGH